MEYGLVLGISGLLVESLTRTQLKQKPTEPGPIISGRKRNDLNSES